MVSRAVQFHFTLILTDATIQALQTKVEKLQHELKRAPKPMQQKSKQPHTKKEGQTAKPQRPK